LGRPAESLIEAHLAETGSRRAEAILHHWEVERRHFLQVCPIEMLPHLAHPLGFEETAQRA
jgi:glutamate synthase (NADPH/NADH) large chain